MKDRGAQRWRTMQPELRQIVMWGAGDQGRVNRHILGSLGCKVVALVDDTPNLPRPFDGPPMLDGWQSLTEWLAGQDVTKLGFVVAIGNPFGHVRCHLHRQLAATGLMPVSFAERSALICRSARLAPGLQVMAHAIIHNEAEIGLQCIVNTKALVEHDCVLHDGVEIGPGAVLCGRVTVGANTWIGAGSTVRQRVTIGRDVIIGAGAVVVKDVPDGAVAVGNPAKPISKVTQRQLALQKEKRAYENG